MDAVFSWVDSTDPVWIASYEKATGLAFESGVRWTWPEFNEDDLVTHVLSTYLGCCNGTPNGTRVSPSTGLGHKTHSTS